MSGPRGFPKRRVRARAVIEGVSIYLGMFDTKAEADAERISYTDAYCPDNQTCHHRHHVKARGGALTRTEHRHRQKALAKGETWHRTK